MFFFSTCGKIHTVVGTETFVCFSLPVHVLITQFHSTVLSLL